MATDIDASDLRILRAKIVDAVEAALDGSERAYSKAGDTLQDAPSVSDVARSVRRTRAWEIAGTAAATAGPIAFSALRRRATRRHAMRAATVAPILVLRSHPVMIGFAAVGGVVAGAALVRRMRARAEQERMDALATADRSLEKQHARMDGEGPTAQLVESSPAAPEEGETRRFVRSNGSSSSITPS